MHNLNSTDTGHSFEDFLASLEEAKAWCSDFGYFSSFAPHLLRTDATQPEFLAGSRKAVVESVIRRRRYSLQTRKLELQQNANMRVIQTRKRQGRLLVYEPDNNMADGAAHLETFGFFDVNNVPPWDTWVAYIVENSGNSYLVCWIPDIYVSLAQKGIDVNPEECIYWLDQSKNELAKLWDDLHHTNRMET